MSACLYVYNEGYDVSTTAKIDCQLADLGLSGKKTPWLSFKNTALDIERAIEKGVKNIAVIGDDGLFFQVFNILSNLSQFNPNISEKTALGFLPVNKTHSFLTRLLGVSFQENACEIFSRRLIVPVVPGVVNKTFYFMAQAIICGDGEFFLNKKISLVINKNQQVVIANAQSADFVLNRLNFPKKFLELNKKNDLGFYIKKIPTFWGAINQKNDVSCFFFQNASTNSSVIKAQLDGFFTLSAPIQIINAPFKINIIVGKNHCFEDFANFKA